MMEKELITNYKQALSQKYNAVCLDIDGTITKNNSSEIDDEFLPVLSNLLKGKVPVVFITGRGETGIFELKNKIVPALKEKYQINEKDLSRLYALTNDGARFFSSDVNGVFNNSEYLISDEDFKNIHRINDEISKFINNQNLSDACKIRYSKDLRTNEIINVRLIIDDKNIILRQLMLNKVNEIIENIGSPNLNVTIGSFNGNEVIQIGASKKSNAILTAENIIGIPENSMIRIGDCGDENGNDYSMLNCSQGFSVDKTSNSITSCFPILDDNGNILKGSSATNFLLKNAKILPAICLEHATEHNYLKSYSATEKFLQRNNNTKMKEYDEIVNLIFNDYDGVNSLFDSTGSIKFRMCDWELIPDGNALKEFWNKNLNNCYQYILKDEDSILLRGSQTYYYIMAHRDNDIANHEIISNWLENYDKFFLEARTAIEKTTELDDVNNKKMILGILDNARNYLLIMLNKHIKNMYNQTSTLLNLEKLDASSKEYYMYSDLIIIEKLMSEISFNTNYRVDSQEISDILNGIIKLSKICNLDFLKSSLQKDDYSKDFRVYREIDSFAENYITVKSCDQERTNENLAFCGIAYGGIELPILQKSLNENIEDVLVLQFSDYASNYKKKQSIELRFFDIEKNGGIVIDGIDRNKDCILMDDNLMTGKSIQIALNIMKDIGINVSGIDIVRYPGTNRVNHMFLKNHGAVNLSLFHEYINGLCFPCPYSYKDPHSKSDYDDSLGVFDLNRKKIVECIVKNGDYTKTSEVGVYIGANVKEEDEESKEKKI